MTKREEIQRLQQLLDVAQGSNKRDVARRINELKLEVYTNKDNEI